MPATLQYLSWHTSAKRPQYHIRKACGGTSAEGNTKSRSSNHMRCGLGEYWEFETAMSVRDHSRRFDRSPMISGLPLLAQPVDATQALNLSAGLPYCKVFRGRSFS